MEFGGEQQALTKFIQSGSSNPIEIQQAMHNYHAENAVMSEMLHLPEQRDDQQQLIANIEGTQDQIYEALQTLADVVLQEENAPVTDRMSKESSAVPVETILENVEGIKQLVKEQTDNIEQIMTNDLTVRYSAPELMLMPREELVGLIMLYQDKIQPVASAAPYTDSCMCCWANCGVQCSTPTELRDHIVDFHINSQPLVDGEQLEFVCEWENCSRKEEPFLKRNRIIVHISTHTEERPFVCDIQGCTKKFARKDSLTAHLTTHSGAKDFSCSEDGCFKKFFHFRSLKKHIKVAHSKSPLESSMFTESLGSSSSELTVEK